MLDAGAAVLLEGGATGFSTVAVAGKAGLSNGAVFNHFDTRLDLLSATVEHALAELRDFFSESLSAVGPDADPAELLTILWECMSRPEQTAITEVFAQSRTNPQLQAMVAPVVQEHHRQIKSMLTLLAEAQIEQAGGGGITADFVEAISFLFIYAMVGLTVNNVAGAGIGTHDEFITLGRQLFEAVRQQPNQQGSR